MKIQVFDSLFYEKTTVGVMLLDGQFFGYTIQDVTRKPGSPKIKNETAIPPGIYKCKVTLSNRFNKPLPLLYDVPNFEGIRIHGGNTHLNTEGCILIASNMKDERIWDSLSDKLVKALGDRDHTIEIVKASPGYWISK